MERAVPEGPPFYPRGGVSHVLSKSAPCTSKHGIRSRHIDRAQNEWNTFLTNRARDNFIPREGHRAEPKQTKAENSRKEEKHSDEGPIGFSRKEIGSHIAQLRNSDFRSPQQLTTSSLGRFTTANDSMLSRVEGDRIELSATAVGNEKRIGKDFIGEGRQTSPEQMVSCGYDGEKYFQSETTTRCLSTKKFRCARSHNQNYRHSALAQLDSSKCPSSQPLLTDESLPATRREKNPSILEGTSSTRSDQLSLSASNGIKHQPGKICTGGAPREDNTVSITSRRKCMLVTNGARSVGVSACTNETDDGQFPPLFESRSRQRCARHARTADGCETRRATKETPNMPHPQVTPVRSEATDSSSYTSEYQHSSTDQEKCSDASADGLSWVDYRVDAEKILCSNEKNANSCHSIRKKILPKIKTQSLKQAEYLGGQLSERSNVRNANTKKTFNTINCDSYACKTHAEGPEPQKEPVCVACEEYLTQRAYVCESGYNSQLGNDKPAPETERAWKTERSHQRRGSWANATPWKARLDCSRSHSHRNESSYVHQLRMGIPRYLEHRSNCTTNVSQALRRKLGDAVNRLRCRGTLRSIRREQPMTWYLHDYQEASPTIPSHAECRCQKEFQQVDTHQIHKTQARKPLLPKGQSDKQMKTLWAESGSRGSDTANAEAPIQNKTKNPEKREDVLGTQPSAATYVSVTADREEAPSQLPRYYPLGSAPVEEPNKLDTSNQSSRSEPFTDPHATDLGESDIRDSPSGSQFGSSVEDGRFMRFDRASAGTTLSTSTVGSEKRFETYPQQKDKQLHRQKAPAFAVEPQRGEHLIQASRVGDLKKPPRSGLEAIRTGGSLSRRLSDVMTQASLERVRNCADTSENENACPSEDILQKRDYSPQLEELPTFVHYRRDALGSITRSQSLDSGSMKRGRSPRTRKHRTKGGDSTITLSDIEASIDWIIEARSNPRLLKAARELLLRREDAERLVARSCYRCRIGSPPVYYPNIDSCIHSSAGESLKANTTTLKQWSQTVSLEESRDDGANSVQSSFDRQPFWVRKVRSTRRGRQFDAKRGLPWTSLYEMRTAQTHGSSRHTHGKEAWSSDTESDSQIQMLKWTNNSRHRKHPQRRYAHDDLSKTFLCYAPSDVAWNTDQLM